MIQLAKIRPKWWLAVYLGLIIGYTLLYLGMSASFVQSTVGAERDAFRQASQRVLHTWQVAMYWNLQERTGSTYIELNDGWTTNWPCILSQPVVPDRGALQVLQVTVTCVASKIGAPTPQALLEFRMSLIQGVDIDGRTDLTRLDADAPRTYPVRIEADPLAVGDLPRASVTAFFGADPGAIGGELTLNAEAGRDIRRLRSALRGDPLGLSGQWARLAYFSAVTITTVGFGDIVPVTDAARLAVASEAVLGIVTAGLFLNSVAGRRRR